MKRTNRPGHAAAVLALVAALVVPGTASAAVARAGSVEASGTQVQTQLQTAEQRRAQLQQRIQEVLRARALRFDNAQRQMTRRVARLHELVGKVEAAGGDCSGVLNMLTLSEQSMARAASLEEDAIEQFRAVPGSANRRAAFAAARQTGRNAVEALREARQRVRTAAMELRRIATELRTGDTQ